MIEFTEITDFNAPELDVYARLTEAAIKPLRAQEGDVHCREP